MKIRKYRYCILAVIVVAIILLAGGHQMPKYVSRLIAIALLAVVDMLYWLAVKKFITGRFNNVLIAAYWLPLIFLLLFFIAGIPAPNNQWPAFPRIYFPGILLILLIGKGIFLTILIAGDIILIPTNLIRKIRSRKIFRNRKWYRPGIFMKIGAALAAFVMLMYVAGMFLWVRDFKLNVVEIPVKNLPVEFDGYKLIQISDIHLGSFLTDKPVQKICSLVNEQHPDVILFTGDMVNFTTSEAYPFENVMKQFAAKDGVYAILGNHDYGEYSSWDSPELKHQNDLDLFAFYKRIGWQLLRNENSIIRRDSASLAIIGVENWSKSKRFGKKGDLKRALAGAESTQFKILMSHDPSHWDAEVNRLYPEIELTLSGHTHAFQLEVEICKINWSPSAWLFKEWAGLYEKTQAGGLTQYLYVNSGAGTLGYLGRIGTRPEITLLVLRRAD